MKEDSIIIKSIIVSAGMFGSVYMYSTALSVLNERWFHKKLSSIDMLNGSILFLTGTSVAINTFYSLYLLLKTP